MRFARLMRFMGHFYSRKMRERFKRFSGIVLFERK